MDQLLKDTDPVAIGAAGQGLDGEKLYRRSDVRRLFQALGDGVLREIKPNFTSDEGLAYPEAETIMGIPSSEVRQVLEFLADQNILFRILQQTMLACPHCNSFTLSTRLQCGKCGSLSLKRGPTLEHLMCGYSDFESSFTKFSNLVCPKCRRELKALGVDYRRLGVLYQCSSCAERTAYPKRVVACAKQDHAFPEEEASLIDVYAYVINPEKRQVIERESIELYSVSERLKDLGWEGRESARRKGESGSQYAFTFLASPYGERIVEDPSLGVDLVSVAIDVVVSEKPISEEQVLSLFGKGFDAKITKLVLVAVPGLTDGAKRIAKFYNIHVLECQSPNSVNDSLFELIRSMAEDEEKKQLFEFMRSIAHEGQSGRLGVETV